MNKHVVLMKCVGYIEVYGASSPEEAIRIAGEQPTNKIQMISGFIPEAAIEVNTTSGITDVSYLRPSRISKKVGRKPTTLQDIPPAFYRYYEMHTEGKLNIAEVARACKISRPSVYKYMKLIKEAEENCHDECNSL